MDHNSLAPQSRKIIVSKEEQRGKSFFGKKLQLAFASEAEWDALAAKLGLDLRSCPSDGVYMQTPCKMDVIRLLCWSMMLLDLQILQLFAMI